MEEKNIWVLPTNKPSRLWINDITGKIELSHSSDVYGALNIYITSNEEPKHLDYYITKIKDSCGERYIVGQRLDTNDSDYSNCKKIILTDNEDLIKDGVQSIEEDFLQWFVQNSDCESVEIEYQTTGLKDGIWQYDYKIIIPQEELPKQYKCTECNWIGVFNEMKNEQDIDYDQYCCPKCNNVMYDCRIDKWYLEEETKQELLKQYPLTPDKCFKQEPKQQTYIQSETIFVGMGYTSEDGSTKFVTKQETLEEQMYKASFANESPLWHDGFIAGSKWQAERMYSEEEVLKILLDSEEYTSRFNGRTDLKKWFKHKKK